MGGTSFGLKGNVKTKTYIEKWANSENESLTKEYFNNEGFVIKEEYQIGTKSITDLIEAESDLLDVNVSYLNAKKEYILNYFKIKALEGNLLDLFKNYIPKIN